MENGPKRQGRKSSGRKERGRTASPFRFTFAGNADKIRVFGQLALKFEKGLQVGVIQKKGVAEREKFVFTKFFQGLRSILHGEDIMVKIKALQSAKVSNYKTPKCQQSGGLDGGLENNSRKVLTF